MSIDSMCMLGARQNPDVVNSVLTLQGTSEAVYSASPYRSSD